MPAFRSDQAEDLAMPDFSGRVEVEVVTELTWAAGPPSQPVAVWQPPGRSISRAA